ncbi:hypothetical protein [Steroidobacter agaridevorans]|nr:hypothetical protein [Steroidobacter agaridevorans]
MADAKIVSVTIGPMPRTLPEGMGDPMPKVHAYFDDGTDEVLFHYYPDEISLTESEFIGLTALEAKALRRLKDVSYLRS